LLRLVAEEICFDRKDTDIAVEENYCCRIECDIGAEGTYYALEETYYALEETCISL
jgi:hypothetical protein